MFLPYYFRQRPNIGFNIIRDQYFWLCQHACLPSGVKHMSLFFMNYQEILTRMLNFNLMILRQDKCHNLSFK